MIERQNSICQCQIMLNILLLKGYSIIIKILSEINAGKN